MCIGQALFENCLLYTSTSAREEDISPLPIKEEGNNETVSSGILDMYNRSKEQYPDAMALIRVGDEYKAYNQDADVYKRQRFIHFCRLGARIIPIEQVFRVTPQKLPLTASFQLVIQMYH